MLRACLEIAIRGGPLQPSRSRPAKATRRSFRAAAPVAFGVADRLGPLTHIRVLSPARRAAALCAVLAAAPFAAAQDAESEKRRRPGAAARPGDAAEHRPDSETNLFGLDADPLTEPIVTDRPDFTESTQAVPRGRFQLEAGYTFTNDHERGVTTTDHAFPELLLRIGLADEWELRLGWAGWSLGEEMFRERNEHGRHVSRNEHTDGGADMTLGFKRHLWDQEGWRPDFGVIGELSLPTGSGEKSSGDVDPAVKLLWAYDLTDRLSVAGNVNLGVPRSARGRFVQSAASLSFGYAWTDWLGSYVEYFGIYPNDRGSDAAHYLNGGFTFPVNDNLQFDIRAGVGLNEEADDFFSGVGFSVRW